MDGALYQNEALSGFSKLARGPLERKLAGLAAEACRFEAISFLVTTNRQFSLSGGSCITHPFLPSVSLDGRRVIPLTLLLLALGGRLIPLMRWQFTIECGMANEL
jgi:hypothetical protein